MSAEGEVADLERFELLHSLQAQRLENRAGGWTLHRKRGDLFGDLADFDVKTDGRIQQPIDLPFRRANPVVALAQAKHGAVIDEMTRIVAPHAIGDAIRLELGEITGHQAIEIWQRIRTRHAVFHHRRQVIERRGVANREIFLLHRGEDIDRGVSRPRYEAIDLGERAGASVKRSFEQRLLEVVYGDLSHGDFTSGSFTFSSFTFQLIHARFRGNVIREADAVAFPRKRAPSSASRVPRGQYLPRGIASGYTHDPASRMASCPTEEQALERRAVLGG